MKRFRAIAGLATIVIFSLACHSEGKRVGGKWVLITQESLMIEAGAHDHILARRGLFGTRPIQHYVYDTADLGDDCLYYASTLQDMAHFCACGDRRPVFIVSADAYEFTLDGTRRLVRPVRDKNARPTDQIETIDLAAVKRKALAQPVDRTPSPKADAAGVETVVVTEPMPPR
jgi:hypothetical protein